MEYEQFVTLEKRTPVGDRYPSSPPTPHRVPSHKSPQITRYHLTDRLLDDG